MNITQKLNIKAITSYLMAYDGPERAAPVEDIQFGTGLGRSTIYRAIDKAPWIKRLEMHGRKARYYVDVELMTAQIDSLDKSRAKKATVNVSTDKAQALKDHDFEHWANHLAGYYQDANRLHGDMTYIAKAYKNAKEFQEGLDSIDPALIVMARPALIRLEEFALALYFKLEAIRTHPAYGDDENFWLIWQKD